MQRRPKIVLVSALAVVGLLLFGLALARYRTFHNETFDLAFYGRMAWGPWRGIFWDPVVGAHMLGLHVSLVILPLGVASLIEGAIIPFLLAVQAAAVVLAAIPFARMAERRFGSWGALAGGAAWLLYPNIGHVATYEWHPGTLAVLPLAYALEALDRRAAKPFLVSALLVLACREDLGLCLALLGLLAFWADPGMRRVGAILSGVSVLYVALFALVLLPRLGPETGSVHLHFGKWGDSLGGAVVGMLTHPRAVLEHLAEPARLTYLPRLLLPLAGLSLLRPKWLIPALPFVAINLMSEWPTTTDLDSHYQTILLPFLVAAAIDGAARASERVDRRVVLFALVGAATVGHAALGGTPLAVDFDGSKFTTDARTLAARAALAEIPEDESVQAPYALMPHLVERELVSAAPPPDKNYAFVVLDAWHRQRYAQDESLLRTSEEPTVRDWLARDDYGLVLSQAPYLVFERGADPRALPRERGILRRGGEAADARGVRLTACLYLVGWSRAEHELHLDMRAVSECGADMAIRIGRGERPSRVDLLFGGLLSPAHLEPGDRLRSAHPLDDAEARAFDAGELRVGLLRSSGARPSHGDPVSVPLR